jgi:arabinogalactan oligomer/maltooligosaccharide transport system substrate-binding protein
MLLNGRSRRIKMKKFMSLLLVMLLMFSLVACGSKTETPVAEKPADTDGATDKPAVEKSIEATISVQVESGWLEYYMSAADRVKAVHPNATINFIETGSFDHLDVLDSTDVTNEDVADVFALPADRIYGLSRNEALATIDAVAMAANVGGFADYDAGLGGNFNVDGEYLAFPMNIETLINFANKANAEAAGVDLSQTMEFTEMTYETMLVPVFNAWFGVALANSANVEMLGMKDDGTLFSDLTEDFANLAPEKQAMFTALFDYWKAHNDANTSLWDNSAAWGYMDTAFTSGGNNVIRLEGPWSTGSLSNLAADGADLAILPINQVTLNGAPLAHWKGGWGLGVNARVEGNEDKMLLAQAMIEEIVNPDFAIEFFKATGKILENVDPSVYMNSDMSDTDKVVVEAVIESYQDAPARPLFTEWGSVWSTWENGLLSWSAVKPATVEEAYAEVQASFKAMMLNF